MKLPARYFQFLLLLACVAVFTAAPSTGTAAEDNSSQAAKIIKDKLDHIIISELNLHEASVSDAIAFLQRKSVELDTTETDPARKGVNIVLKLEAAPAPGAPAISSADTRITVSLTNIPMSAALDYITKQAGLKYKIEPYAIKIVPLSEPTDILITKEYKVPPDFFSKLGAVGGDTSLSLPARQLALDVLKNDGVQFPPGASASFLPQSSKLVVRNTQENLDLVDKIVGNLANAPGIESSPASHATNALPKSFPWLLVLVVTAAVGVIGFMIPWKRNKVK